MTPMPVFTREGYRVGKPVDERKPVFLLNIQPRGSFKSFKSRIDKEDRAHKEIMLEFNCKNLIFKQIMPYMMYYNPCKIDI